jgi:hypothetical protein
MSEVIGENVNDANPETRETVTVLREMSPPAKYPDRESGLNVGVAAAVVGTMTPVKGQVWFTPVWLPGGVQISTAYIPNTERTTGGGVARMGLYRRGDRDEPTTLVADFGARSMDDASLSSNTSMPLDPPVVVPESDWYWLAFVEQGTGTQGTYRSVVVAAGIPLNLAGEEVHWGPDPVQAFAYCSTKSGGGVMGALPALAIDTGTGFTVRSGPPRLSVNIVPVT